MKTKMSRAEFLTTGARGVGMATMFGASSLTGMGAPASDGPATANTPIHCDLRGCVEWIVAEFEPSVRLPGGAGRYARSPGQTAPEIYGIADMACVLHTLQRLRPTTEERAQWSAALHEFQQPDSGWFCEKDPTHTPLHNTAFALAAMELLGVEPRRPVEITGEFADMRGFLETIDWRQGVYAGSHKGAGLGAIHALVPALGTPAWFSDYFAFCDSLFDSRNGLMGRDKPAGGDFDQIGGTFHYHFIYSHFNRHMPFPTQRIDAVLRLQQPDGFWHEGNHLWLTLDAIYLMTRTLRQQPHRFDEVRSSVRRAVAAVQRAFYEPEVRKAAFATKLGAHSLTAAVSIAAEAQQFLGTNEVVTEVPLKLVLDRRPFI